MYIVYCQNKPKSEHIVSEYIDTFFEVRSKTETAFLSLLLSLLFKTFNINCYPGVFRKLASMIRNLNPCFFPINERHKYEFNLGSYPSSIQKTGIIVKIGLF